MAGDDPLIGMDIQSKPVSERRSVEVAIGILKGDREIMIMYLKMKTLEEDWHGVCDAANDIRVIEAKLEALKRIMEKLPG